MARATFRQRPPTRGIPAPRAACALQRFLKNRSCGGQAHRTLYSASPNSRFHTPPRSATGIRANARAYTPGREGGPSEKVCSTAFPGQPAKAEPSVSAKLLDAAPTTAERFSEHLRAASGALGQSRTGLPRRAVRAVELSRNLQVRSCKPDPLGADIVHVREDRRNGAGLAGRFGSPGGGVKMFDKNLVHALICGKGLDCGSAQLSVKLSVNLGLTRGHGSYSLTYDTSGRSATLPLISRKSHLFQSQRHRLLTLDVS